MSEDESLREALLEIDALRRREAAASRESRAMLEGLTALTGAADPEAGVAAFLAAVRGVFDCAAAATMVAAGEDAELRDATDPALAGRRLRGAAGLIARGRRVVDLAALPGGAGFAPHRSALIAPAPRAGGGAPEGALVCLGAAPGAFSSGDLALLGRMSGLAAQALAAAELGRRNALLAAVIEGAAAGFAIADAARETMPLIYVNEAFERLTGWPAAEALGRNCRFLHAEPVDAPERTRLREAVARREGGEFEILNRRRDGALFWNRLTLFPVAVGGRAATHMVATQTDITARRRAEAERDAARERLVSALSAAEDGFLLVDGGGRVVFANDRWRDFHEADAPAVPGADFAAVWAAGLRAAGLDAAAAEAGARERLSRLLSGGPRREERLPDGRVLLVADSPAPDGGGVSIAADVTRVRTTERMLAQRAVAIDAAQDGVAITDPAGRFVYLNPRHVEMFGYAREGELLGRSWEALYDPEAAEELRAAAFPALQRDGAWQGEVEGRRADGGAMVQDVSLTLMPDGGLVCVTRDASERRRAGEERARLEAQLVAAQRQEAVGRLAAGVAHDFNNLLSAIGGSAELLAEDLGADPRAVHARRILSAGVRAGELVTRLTRLGKRSLDARTTDLREPVAEAGELLRAGLPRRVTLEVAPGAEALRAMVSPTEVVQVALNLGINARDAIGAGEGRIRVGLGAARPEGVEGRLMAGMAPAGRRVAVLQVDDSGPGVPPEAAARLFEPYYSTKGDRGTGLGLSVVSSVAEAAGGAVALGSSPLGGARFTVYWPLEGEAEAGAVERTPDVEAARPGAAVRLDGVLALVVEDVPEVAEVIAATLERAGAETAVCIDPRDALEAVREDPGVWGLLVTDHDMPGMTGGELARAVRRLAPGLPILLCSALAEARRHASGEGADFDGVLAKPPAPGRLLAAAAAARAARGGEDAGG